MKQIRTLIFVVILMGCSNIPESNSVTNDFKVAPYLQFATQNSMVILWETDEAATTLVEFGESVLNSGEPVLNQSRSIDGNRTMHEVVLDGLKTETNYFYRVRSEYEDGSIIESDIYPFKTAVNDDTAYMFALVGDSQRNSGTPWAWERIANLVWEDRPNFVVHVGDIVDLSLIHI